MKIINLSNALFVLIVIILFERLYEILTIKKIKPKKIYNAYTTWFLTLSYLLLNAIVLVEFINKKEVSIFLLIIGLVIYLISVIYRRDAIETLGIYFRPDVSFITNHHLCTSGIYAAVRHPYYLGSLLEVVAIPIIFSSVWGILFCLCVNMPLLFMRIFIEEKALIDYFGSKYLEYSCNVPQLFNLRTQIKNNTQDIYSLFSTIGIKNLNELALSKKQNTNHVRGYFVASCICALLKIDFFETLYREGSIFIDSFCKQCGYDFFSLRAICEYLVAMAVLETDGSNIYRMNNSFRLTPSTGAYHFINGYAPIFSNLEDLLRGNKKYGEEIERDIKYVAIASAETEQIVPYPYAKKLLKKWKINSILDLGCGNAGFLLFVADVLTEKSYGMDISGIVVNAAHDNIEKNNLGTRLSVFQGDITKLNSINIKPEALTALYILHEFVEPEDEIGKLSGVLFNLKKCFPESKLLVMEGCKYRTSVLRENKSLIAEHHLFHQLSHQNLLSFDMWERVFLMSGYKILEKIELKIAGQGFFVLG